MTPDRTRGAVLYAGAAVLLAAAGVWWVRATPREPVDPILAQWTATAQRLLPEPDDAQATETMEIGAGLDRMVSAKVEDGPHHIEVVCVGGANSLARVTLGSRNDSGRGLDCAGDQPPTKFDVALVGGLRMNVSAGDTSAVIFRYTVTKGTE